MDSTAVILMCVSVCVRATLSPNCRRAATEEYTYEWQGLTRQAADGGRGGIIGKEQAHFHFFTKVRKKAKSNENHLLFTFLSPSHLWQIDVVL